MWVPSQAYLLATAKLPSPHLYLLSTSVHTHTSGGCHGLHSTSCTSSHFAWLLGQLSLLALRGCEGERERGGVRERGVYRGGVRERGG